MSAEGAKNVSWPWLSPLRGWGSLTMAFVGKFAYIYIYIYIHIYTYIHIYIYIYTHTNLPVNAIVRLPHPWSGDSQGQEKFLAPSAEKRTQSYDTEQSAQTAIPLYQP